MFLTNTGKAGFPHFHRDIKNGSETEVENRDNNPMFLFLKILQFPRFSKKRGCCTESRKTETET